ncbi:MAG: ligase [Rhizobiales bacterium]|nr:ligase [Hyphomicrobiales bacterium]
MGLGHEAARIGKLPGNNDNGPGNLKRPDFHVQNVPADASLGVASTKRFPVGLQAKALPDFNTVMVVAQPAACINQCMSGVTRSTLVARLSERARLAPVADGLAIAAAVSLPWSVTAASVAIALWLVVVLPTLHWADLRRSFTIPAGALPVLLFLLAIAGATWSEAPPADQFGSLKIFARLVIIAVLFAQFQHSERGLWVVGGFLASCTVLLVVSWLFWLFPSLAWRGRHPGVPVRDYIVQSGEFLICVFATGHLALDTWRHGQRSYALALGLLALMFLASITYVASGRSTLVALVVLVLLFVFQRFRWRQALGVVTLTAAIAALTWMSSSYLRTRVLNVIQEVHDYRTTNAATSSGYRLEFWARSVVFVSQAPIIGHGTGSLRDQFGRAAVGSEGIPAVTDNPHNQTLFVAIQLGGLGTMLLFAMWFAHLLLFRGDGLVAWLGTALVVQNIVAGLFNASLVEFTYSWMYIFGVGILGGMMLRVSRSGFRGPAAGSGMRHPLAD